MYLLQWREIEDTIHEVIVPLYLLKSLMFYISIETTNLLSDRLTGINNLHCVHRHMWTKQLSWLHLLFVCLGHGDKRLWQLRRERFANGFCLGKCMSGRQPWWLTSRWVVAFRKCHYVNVITYIRNLSLILVILCQR